MRTHKLSLLVILVSLAFIISGCAMGVGAPVTGVIFKDATGPYMATQNEIGSKTGQATAISLLGIVGTGDAGIAAAAKNGNITKISTVDQRGMRILGLYAESTTIVTGE